MLQSEWSLLFAPIAGENVLIVPGPHGQFAFGNREA